MDVTLGVSVDPTGARITLLEAEAPNATLDRSEIELTGLLASLVSTERALTTSGHRLVGTTLCASDADQATELLTTLVGADLKNVAVVPVQEAATAAVRALGDTGSIATLVNDGTTVALSMVSAGGATSPIAVEALGDDDAAAYRTLVQRLATDPGAATGLIVLGPLGEDGLPADVVETSPVPLRFPDDSEFALARGAALAGVRQDATMASPALPPPVLDATMASAALPSDSDPRTAATPMDHAHTVQGEQLAYSEAADDDSADPAYSPADYSGGEYSDFDYDEAGEELDYDEPDVEVRRRQMLIGSSVGALAVVGFATLAVSVAITVQPTASQQAIRLQEETVPGKAFPVAPGQGVAPDGPNWTMIEQLPPPGVVNEVRTFETRMLSSTRNGAAQAAPAVVNLYQDGTAAVQNLAAPLLPVDPGAAIPAIAPRIPQLSDYATRLIPDFSVITVIEVLNFLANLPQIIGTNATVPSVWDRGLGDIGVLAVVPKNQGALFSTTAGTVNNVIPKELFEPDKSSRDKVQTLPPGATLIDQLPATTDDAAAATELSEVLLNPESAPVERTEQDPAADAEPGTDSQRTDSDGTTTSPEPSAENGPEPSTEPSAEVTEPESSPTVTTPTPSEAPATTAVPTSEPTVEPTTEPTVEPTTVAPTTVAPTTVAPTTVAPTQAPTRTAVPTVAPEPEATVAPAPEPVPTVAPAPEPAPTVAPAPEPVITQAPVAVETAVTVPTLPELSSGSGSRSSSSADE